MKIPTPQETAQLISQDTSNAAKMVIQYKGKAEPVLAEHFRKAIQSGKVTHSKGSLAIPQRELGYVDLSTANRAFMQKAIKGVVEAAGWKIITSFYPETTAGTISLEILNPDAELKP